MTKHDQQAYTNLFARPFMPFTGLNDLIQPSSITSIWPIHNLLPIGLTLLSGESRSGKTSLALQLMLNVTQGQSSFAGEARDDSQPFKSTRGHAFYLGLDHSLLRLHELRSRLLSAQLGTPPPNNLFFTNTWTPLTPTEGLYELQSWLTNSPDTHLLVIDNLASLRPLFKGNDRELLALLRRLAEQQDISILVLHTCKRSSSLTASVDHHLHLKRLPVSNYYHLDVLGSSLAPFSLTLHCPTSHIHFRHASLEENLALTTLSAHKTLTPERVTILHLIHTCEHPLSPAQVTAALGLDYTCVRQLLSKMARANLLYTTSRGHYTLHPFIKPLVPELLAQYPHQLKFEIAHILPTPDSEDTHSSNPSDTPESSTPNTPHSTQPPDTTSNLASQIRIAHNLTPPSPTLLTNPNTNTYPD
ncbi:AAA family ATPase [Ktedonobacter sp. SOSP1-52]|uniref:AAA family ATPase n=1 Tax=Ktedonobacter sp. SOSP1-52 TaxID=2778366 RepID=UPI001F18A774|nr:AAA family ATPase [Ktedonobacter sp. SOSP1-52]